jgi:hypothetical protein
MFSPMKAEDLARFRATRRHDPQPARYCHPLQFAGYSGHSIKPRDLATLKTSASGKSAIKLGVSIIRIARIGSYDAALP